MTEDVGRFVAGRTARGGSAGDRAAEAAAGAGRGPAPVTTARLVLEPLAVRHAAEMAAVLADPALHRFIGGAPQEPEALRARYARLVAGSPDPEVTWWNWVIRLRADDRLTGTVQATIVPCGGGRTAEVAWVVGTAWQGRGIATEAARAMVGLVAAEPGVSAVVAHIHPDHVASAAVAATAGLRPTDECHDGEVRWRMPVERPADTPGKAGSGAAGTDADRSG